MQHTFLDCNFGHAVYLKYLTDSGQESGVLRHMPEVQGLYLCRETGYRVKFLVVFFKALEEKFRELEIKAQYFRAICISLSINIFLLPRFLFSTIESLK